jgi:hypothetical protein
MATLPQQFPVQQRWRNVDCPENSSQKNLKINDKIKPVKQGKALITFRKAAKPLLSALAALKWVIMRLVFPLQPF